MLIQRASVRVCVFSCVFVNVGMHVGVYLVTFTASGFHIIAALIVISSYVDVVDTAADVFNAFVAVVTIVFFIVVAVALVIVVLLSLFCNVVLAVRDNVPLFYFAVLFFLPLSLCSCKHF